MELGVTHKKNSDGTVVLYIGNIGEMVYVPDSAFLLLPCLRKKLGSDAGLFPLFLDEGRKVRLEIGNVNGESVVLSEFERFTAGELTQQSECENLKARLEKIRTAIETAAHSLQTLLASGEDKTLHLPSPKAVPELYRYAESSLGGYCFIVLGIARIGTPHDTASVAEVAAYFSQLAERLFIQQQMIDSRLKKLKPSLGGKFRDLVIGKKTVEPSGIRMSNESLVWDILDGKRSATPQPEAEELRVSDTTAQEEVPSVVQPLADQVVPIEPMEQPAGGKDAVEQRPIENVETQSVIIEQTQSLPDEPVPQISSKQPEIETGPTIQENAKPNKPQVPADKGWVSLPSDQQAKYAKEDSASAFLSCGDVSIVAASLRGRSHAQKGDFREDDFRIYYDSDTQCAFLAVSDGAGSAKYSRKGSEIAVRTAVEEAAAALTEDYWSEAEPVVRNWNEKHGELDGKNLAIKLYPLIQAAFKARTAIFQEAGQQNAKESGTVKVKDFAATLILSIVKKFDFGWLVATYWVGDGGACVYKQSGRKATVMGEGDSGEFAGETLFLTSSDVWQADAQALIDRRLRFGVFKSFKAIALMTDGVTDAKFGTAASFADFSKWDEFWTDISGAVPFERRDKSSADALLKWLDFQAKGEFDDRTLIMLY